MSETIVIVGANIAGVSVAKGLRDFGFPGSIVLIDRDPNPSYHRPPLSKSFLLDLDAEPEPLFLPSAALEQRIELRLGIDVRSVSIDPPSVSLDDGSTIEPSAVVLCPGSRARRLFVPGGDLPGVHYLRDRDDAVALRRDLHVAQTVAVIGGGLIGLELASTARALGKDVTVIEQQEQLCARILPPTLARRLRDRHEACGVRVLTGRKLERIDKNAGAYSIRFATGTDACGDVVLVGIGATPNCELAADAGLDVDDGIIVNEEGRTSAAGFYAAGDAARIAKSASGRRESFTDAGGAGLRVAGSITGQPGQSVGASYFWSDQHGRTLQAIGELFSEPTEVVDKDFEWCALWRQNNLLIGAAAYGMTREFAGARRAMQRRVPFTL